MPKRAALFSILTLLLLTAAARADGFLVPVSDRLPVRGPYAVKDHRVRITVEGQRATTEVRQSFVNLTRAPLEVHYLFPVPEGGMIESFTLVVDGKPMTGRLLPAAEAQSIYESIVRKKRDPALLTYAGRGLVKTSVFPIPAGGWRELVIRYEELLSRDGDLVKLVYPLDTERFSAKPIEVVDVTVDIRATSPIKAVYSPSHAVRLERPSETRAIARLTEERTIPDKDLTLYYSVGRGDVGASLLTYFAPGERSGHFLLLLSPRALPSPDRVMGKNLVIVADHSGSMRGEKIEQTKEALRFVLNSLTEKDRVDIVGFSSAPRSLFGRVRPADQQVRGEALAFVSGMVAGGGTDIHGALTLAMASMPEDPSRQNVILFLTDGLPTVGLQDPNELVKQVTAANRKGRDSRLFVFGVGYDVNAALLDRLVEENGGISENVKPKENVEIAVTSLYRKISQPVLTDLSLAINGVRVHDVYPKRLPDLFAGSQLILTGRYERGGKASVILGGRAGAKPMAYRFSGFFETASDPDERPFVARVWATTKIGYLLDQMRVMGRREKELVDEIVRLSTKYGIVTEYTAFLADETNDFRALAANAGVAQRELQDRMAENTGSWGSNQAVNTKGMRYGRQAQDKNRWFDRDGKAVDVLTVRNDGRKTFYRRGGVWIDREVKGDEEVEEVRQFSPRFFELVRGQRAVENRWLSFREPTLVRLSGRVVKILPAK